jgi:hypothetical protein
MAFAALRPIPDTCCDSSEVAEFKSTECAGGKRLASASTCTTNNAIRETETASNVPEVIGHLGDFSSSHTISLRVVLRDCAEQSGLVGDLCAVAD